MNTTLTLDVPVNAKKSARRTAESKARPATEVTVQEQKLGDSPPDTATTTAAKLPEESCFAAPSTTSDAPPLDPPEPEALANAADEAPDNEENDGEQNATVNLTPEAIVEFARDDGTDFFQDQHGNVFAWIRKSDGEHSHFECLRLRSRAFLARLLELIKSKAQTSPPPKALKQAIEVLEIQAYGTTRKELDNRRKAVGDETFIDLGDPEWRMVAITRNGWQVRSQDCPRFFRPQHLLPLPEPVSGGDVTDLYKFVPLETDEEKLLLMTWAVAGLYAAIPSPILVFVGQQGSAKTTRSRRLRSLLDPSITPVLGDLEMSDLFLTFQHHAVPCFENVSSFRRREADMFCRAVTGNGVERRKLYTDSDQVLYSFRRPIIINGIDTPSTRPDFLDRCLIINCRRMEKFATLLELDQQFEAARPRLFGALLDLLVKTLAVLESTPAADEFRMADFAHFGRAVAVALGKQPVDFDKAYRLNVQQQNYDILEDSPMAKLVERVASKLNVQKPWVGTSDELLAKLRDEAHVLGDSNVRDDLPKSPRWLSSRLGELAPALASRGVMITKLKRTNATRLWQISPKVVPQDPTAEPDDLFHVLEEAGQEGTDK